MIETLGLPLPTRCAKPRREAADLARRLEDDRPMAPAREIVCGRETGEPRTDDGDPHGRVVASARLGRLASTHLR